MISDTIDKEAMKRSDNNDIKELLKYVEKNNGEVAFFVIIRDSLKFSCIQFIIGLIRCIGFSIGGLLAIGLISYILSFFISINIPYLSDQFKQFLQIISEYKNF